MEKEKKLKRKLTKEDVDRINKLSSEINAIYDETDVPEDFAGRPACVRINGAGNIEWYNCKTGEIIK